MSMTYRTQAILAEALGNKAAAAEVKNLIAAATGGVGTDPSVATLVTSGAATIGGACALNGDTTIASGKVLKIGTNQLLTGRQTAPTNVAITFSANAPATYASPATTKTVADGSSPTVAELLDLVCDLRGVIASILTVLHTHGLTT